MNPIIEGAIVTHVFYVNLVGEVLRIDDRFGVLVQWKSEDQKMAHMCRQPQRHPLRLLAPADEWKSVPKSSEGLNCFIEDTETTDEDRRIYTSRLDTEVEDDALESEEPVSEAIEEACDSDPLPTELEEELIEDEP